MADEIKPASPAGGEKIPVSELKYEKEGSILKIILNSEKYIDPQKIQIEKETEKR